MNDYLNNTGADAYAALDRAAKRSLELVPAVEVLRALVEAGADVNVPNKTCGRTALHLAAIFGHTEQIRILIAAGAVLDLPDDDGETALHLAVTAANTALVRTLIEAGADLELRNNSGKTALDIAALFGYVEVVQALLEHGADATSMLDKTTVITLLADPVVAANRAIAMEFQGNELAHRFINDKLDFSAYYDRWCVRHPAEDPQHAQFKDDCGKFFDHLYAHGREAEKNKAQSDIVIRLLRVPVAQINDIDADGCTALHRAASRSAKLEAAGEALRAIIEADADLNLPNDRGQTALHLAAIVGSTALVRALMEAGADLELRNNSGKTALDTAASLGHVRVVQALLEHGADTTPRSARPR